MSAAKTNPKDPRFEALLDYLRRTRGFDFGGYKRSSLMRRVEHRLQSVGVTDFTDYVDYLEVHPEEFERLFNTILINVTAFLRDDAPWQYLREEIIPGILSQKGSDEPIRVWSAGCASGEEAYSLAMLFAEAMGLDAFRARARIYATDVDEEALATARAAAYPPKELATVPEEMRARYFQAVGDKLVFQPDLRRAVIFGRHDLLQDAPISRLDLLVCRNTLMYFNSETQARVLARLHFGLNDLGFLFLGKAEMLLTHAKLFRPVDLGHRVFAKAPASVGRPPVVPAQHGQDALTPVEADVSGRVRDAALETGPVATMVVDAQGRVVVANERMRTVFGLAERDLGRPLQDLDISYRPLELRSLIDQALSERRAVSVADVNQQLASQAIRSFDVLVVPLLSGAGAPMGVSVSFTDVSDSHRMRDEVTRLNHELEAAYDQLQSAHEALETTNEELQSTNEELETTNEELQSTNEELETMNEELQSTNSELQAINDELGNRSRDLNVTNTFLRSILASIRSAVIVVDAHLRVLIWNRQADELWGLRPEEAEGQPLLSLDIGLPVDKIPLAALLAGRVDHEELDFEAMNRRGRSIKCHATCTAFASAEDGSRGAVLLIEEIGHE